MKEELIREYVSSILQEAGFVRSLSDFRGDSGGKHKKKGRGVIHRIKSFFTGHGKADALSSDWIEDAEMNYDFDLPEQLKSKVQAFVRTKYDVALRRAKGDESRADSLVRRALDTKYRNYLRSIQREREKEMSDGLDDEEEID